MSKKRFLYSIFYASFICALLCSVVTMQAQISEGGLPLSFSYPEQLKSESAPLQIPVDFSVEDMKAVDAWQVSQGAPLKVVRFIDTNLSITNSGNWVTLPNGQKIWQLRIQAKGAIALMLGYKSFYIPAGGKLFIYNAAKTQVLGAYTYRTNPPTDQFATEFISGDDLVLEYEAASDTEKPLIEIEKVGYGYNHLEAFSEHASAGPGGAAPCMVNINCEEGADWQAEKSGVCEMILIIGKYGYYCSGSLVNNTKEDQKPYILSATHCISTVPEAVTQNEMNQYLFYFHFERVGCDNNSPAYRNYTMTGCTKVASTPLSDGSDGLLLLLNQRIPDDYYVYFNGWDRRNIAAQAGVGIHHPNGDYMKISTFGNLWAKEATWYGENNVSGAVKAHWTVVFDPTTNGHSVTEGGSSGSPLFNADKLIVGTLTGGNSSCDKPDGINQYGKFYYHWDKFSTADTARMDKWLDPLGKGTLTLAGRYQTPSSTSIEKTDAAPDPNDVSIYPVTFNEQIRIANSDRVRSLEILSIDGKLIQKTKDPEEVISTGSLASGVYIFRLYTDKGIKAIQTIKK